MPIGIILLTLGCLVLIFIVSPFLPMIPAWILWAIILSFVILSLTEFMLRKSVSRGLPSSWLRKTMVVSLSVILLFGGILILIRLPRVYEYPDKEQCILLDLPVHGTWQAGHAGATTAVNYHSAYPSQKYAMDIVKVNDRNEFFMNNGSEISDHFTMGENIYAPCDGEVVIAKDGLPNEPVSFSPSNPYNPAGNHVVIKMKDSVYIYLAHLDSGTVEVRKGDLVSSGDMIGRAGNSGNTSWPHLHLHIQDIPEMDMDKAKAIPYRFREIRRKRIAFWHKAEDAYLIRNDLFSQVESGK
jgi:hypothetical protein